MRASGATRGGSARRTHQRRGQRNGHKNKTMPTIGATLALLGGACQTAPNVAAEEQPRATPLEIVLPHPLPVAPMSLEHAIADRRSRREFAPRSLSVEQISKLLWAAQGITDHDHGLRAAPSAGALYPLELYVVDHMAIWQYEAVRHRLRRVARGDHRPALADASFGQAPAANAAIDLVFTGVLARNEFKYGQRATRYVHLEAGHAAQNVLLEATALGLAAVPLGAFDDDRVRRVLGAGSDETPLYILCVGRPTRQ